MSKQITIKHLKLRVPASHAGSPKQLASQVAQQLSSHAVAWDGGTTNVIKTSVRPSVGTSLAADIATAVNRSVKGEES